MNAQSVLILDHGGQYAELTARRVRECGVHSTVLYRDAGIDEIRAGNYIGIILTGGDTIAAENGALCDAAILRLGIPVLGIGYGAHCILRESGTLPLRRGVRDITLDTDDILFASMEKKQTVFVSCGQGTDTLPEDFSETARSDGACMAFSHRKKPLYGLFFHPETDSTPNGLLILRHFLYDVCHALGDYHLTRFLRETVESVRRTVGKNRVLLGLSGGLDSAVCSALLSKAIGRQLICIFVDTGLLRSGEAEEIRRVFSAWDMEFICVDASERILEALRGVTDPRLKRETVRAQLTQVFAQTVRQVSPDHRFVSQGTLYSDEIDRNGRKSSVLAADDPDAPHIIEPLRPLFKDEVKKIGKMLGLPRSILARQPFPAPGLAVRIIGEVTGEKLRILRQADAILREEAASLRDRPDQYFAVLCDIPASGIGYGGYTVAIRAVRTNDFMTCEYAHLPHSFLGRVSERITREVGQVVRVVYDITGKPPATVEWQ